MRRTNDLFHLISPCINQSYWYKRSSASMRRTNDLFYLISPSVNQSYRYNRSSALMRRTTDLFECFILFYLISPSVNQSYRYNRSSALMRRTTDLFECFILPVVPNSNKKPSFYDHVATLSVRCPFMSNCMMSGVNTCMFITYSPIEY